MKLAAIGYDAGQGEGVDAMLRALAHDLMAQGYKLAGAVQWNEVRQGQQHDAMILEDLATGNRLDVSGHLGAGANGCRLDSYALETVARSSPTRLIAMSISSSSTASASRRCRARAFVRS